MPVDRRTVLQGLAAMSAWADGSGEAASAKPKSTLGWPSQEVLRLWPGDAPGHTGFRAPNLPSDWPARFLRGIDVPAVHVFRPKRPDGRSVLVCPGGAYLFVSIENEGVDLARTLNAFGITVFVLAYRLPCEGWAPRSDVPLQDSQRALRLIRHHAVNFQIDPDCLGVLGFSAGGHLAASLATAWTESVYAPVDAADRASAQPAHAALMYPVVSLRDGLAHVDSRRFLLGDYPSSELILQRSPERHVSRTTPRFFITHACDDSVVSVEHARLFQSALYEAQVPHEPHLFETGEHAYGVGRPGTPSALWPALYDAWLRG